MKHAYALSTANAKSIQNSFLHILPKLDTWTNTHNIPNPAEHETYSHPQQTRIVCTRSQFILNKTDPQLTHACIYARTNYTYRVPNTRGCICTWIADARHAHVLRMMLVLVVKSWYMLVPRELSKPGGPLINISTPRTMSAKPPHVC